MAAFRPGLRVGCRCRGDGDHCKDRIPAGSGLAGIILLLPALLILSFAFALAAVGWSLWSLKPGERNESSRSFVAFGVSLVTAALIAAYLLVLSGVIRIKR